MRAIPKGRHKQKKSETTTSAAHATFLGLVRDEANGIMPDTGGTNLEQIHELLEHHPELQKNRKVAVQLLKLYSATLPDADFKEDDALAKSLLLCLRHYKGNGRLPEGNIPNISRQNVREFLEMFSNRGGTHPSTRIELIRHMSGYEYRCEKNEPLLLPWGYRNHSYGGGNDCHGQRYLFDDIYAHPEKFFSDRNEIIHMQHEALDVFEKGLRNDIGMKHKISGWMTNERNVLALLVVPMHNGLEPDLRQHAAFLSYEYIIGRMSVPTKDEKNSTIHHKNNFLVQPKQIEALKNLAQNMKHEWPETEGFFRGKIQLLEKEHQLRTTLLAYSDNLHDIAVNGDMKVTFDWSDGQVKKIKLQQKQFATSCVDFEKNHPLPQVLRLENYNLIS